MWTPDEVDETVCAECGGRVGEYNDPEAEPELCTCCDTVLCWMCWADQHTRVFRER